MAEHDKPVHRRVALKIIKPGMDSAQVIARFEAEKQALAMMEHQNIAKAVLSVNLASFFHVAQWAARRMRERGSSHIVNITAALTEHHLI